MHGEKDHVDPNKGHPKLKISHPFGNHFPGHFGEPIVKSCKNTKESPHGENIMKMRHHKIGIMERNIHTSIGQGDPCDPSYNEQNNKSNSIKHGRFKNEGTSPHGSDPTENFNSCWNGNNKGGR